MSSIIPASPEQVDELKKSSRRNLIIAIISLVIALVSFLYVFRIGYRNKETLEKKYQACLEKCGAKYPDKLDFTAFGGVNEKIEYDVCTVSCREKYGK